MLVSCRFDVSKGHLPFSLVPFLNISFAHLIRETTREEADENSPNQMPFAGKLGVDHKEHGAFNFVDAAWGGGP